MKMEALLIPASANGGAPPVIRPAEPGDKKAILALLNAGNRDGRYFALEKDDAFWTWKYENSVFGDSVIYVAEAEGELIGASSLWPWEFTCRGRVFRALQPCDTVVRSDFQRRGIFKQMNLTRIPAIIEKGVPFVFNFPNDQSLPGNRSLGWHYLGRIPWAVKILRPMSLASRFRAKGKSVPVLVAQEDRVNPELCDEVCRSEVAGFWGHLATHRVPGFFHWRYARHPFFPYGMIHVEWRGKAAGAIYSIYERSGHLEMIVVDLFGSSNLTEKLFGELGRLGKKYGADFVASLYNRQMGMDRLWFNGFIRVKRKNMVVLPIELLLESKLTDLKNWSILGAMHDAV